MNEVIIHLGLHKTASSSIQVTCANNGKLLRKYGYYYPIFEYDDKKINNHSIPFYSLFCDSPRNYHINIKWGVDAEQANREYRNQLDQIVSRKENIILSGEGISTLPEKSLLSLKQYFESNGFRIRAIAFVRSPVSYQISAAQERVKNGSVISYSNRYFPCSKIRKLQSVFSPNIDFFPFRAVCAHDYGPTGFFLELAGLNKKDFKNINYFQRNESLSDQAVRLISYINEVEPFFIINRSNNNREINPNRSYQDTVDFQKIGGNKYKPSHSEIQHIMEKAKQENDWLRDNMGNDFCDDEMDLHFNDTTFHWDRKNMQQLQEAFAGCSAPLRKVVYDFIENKAYTSNDDYLALRRILDL